MVEAAAYEKVVPIASCGSRWEAELKRSLLDAEGYRVAIASDDAGGLHPELSFLACAYRLMVPETEAVAARALLDEVDARPVDPDDAPPPTTNRALAFVTVGALIAVLTYRAWAIINGG